MKIAVELIKKLREETGAPIVRVKEVLEAFDGKEKKALEVLRKEGFEKAEKREGRATGQGKIFTYAHHTGKIVAVIELLCETDFVAKNELFETLGRDIAMQAASMGEKDIEKQEFIKKVPVEMLVLETDSPFLLPEPLRSQKKYPNEPANISIIYKFISQLCAVNIEDLQKTTTDNAHRLFSLS